MEKTSNNAGKAVVAALLIFAVFALVLFGMNRVLSPIAEANAMKELLAPLYNVLPGAKGFKPLYVSEETESSDFQVTSGTVTAVYEETSGLGYAVSCVTSEGFTKEPMAISVGVSADGTIAGAQVDTYPDSKDMGVATYPLTYVGQDSSLKEVELVAGTTYSSSAFKGAVSDAMETLVANELISAGLKPADQLLKELLPLVHTGMATFDGIMEYKEKEGENFRYITLEFQSDDGNGYACLTTVDDAMYLVVVNAEGSWKVYDSTGADVTAEAEQAMIDEAVAEAEAVMKDFTDEDMSRVLSLMPRTTEAEQLALTDQFTSVTSAFKLSYDGNTYYGFVARPFDYANQPVVVTWILDNEGKIMDMNADEFVLMSDYYTDYTLDEKPYRAGFFGLTETTATGDETVIAGATLSSGAVKQAEKDVFAAFNAVRAKEAE